MFEAKLPYIVAQACPRWAGLAFHVMIQISKQNNKNINSNLGIRRLKYRDTGGGRHNTDCVHLGCNVV